MNVRDSRPLSLQAFDALLQFFNTPFVRTLTLGLARLLILFRAIVPGALIQHAVLAFVRMEASCCTRESPHYKFLQRYVSHFEQAGTINHMRTFLRTAPRGIAARRLDAWVRMGAFSTLRHEVFGRYLGKHGVPPKLLTEAQLALSPGCDLACEGCYTAEDRGGRAPSRERIAYLVDEAVSCGAFSIYIVGKGEPFLSPAWTRELLSVIQERPHVFFVIATHGMRIDDALASALGHLGNVFVLVSVDGPRMLHDARRGEGSYDRVQEALARLRAQNVAFGFSCMVSAKNYEGLTSRAFIADREASGASVGIFSRYFPLTGESLAELALDSETLSAYTQKFDSARRQSSVTLLDLDEVEQHTGCHSRAGESIYIDGITGQVSPCLRVPFAPKDCSLGDARIRGQLATALSHRFFMEYRSREKSCPSWCGANLPAELAKVNALVSEHGSPPARLSAYEIRSHEAQKRRLPLLTTEKQR
jgi:sulfatase maturation enzyme AslB (radical SAM superfamily)